MNGLPTSSPGESQHIVALGSRDSGRAISAFLQGPQACLSASLMEHMGEKLLEGEWLPYQPSQRQGFDDLLLMEYLHAAQRGIQLQDDVMADQVSRDIVALEI